MLHPKDEGSHMHCPSPWNTAVVDEVDKMTRTFLDEEKQSLEDLFTAVEKLNIIQHNLKERALLLILHDNALLFVLR